MGYLDIRKLMPDDWDDHTQWDVYYEACRKENLQIDPTTHETDVVGTRFIPLLTANGWRKIWVPGCGGRKWTGCALVSSAPAQTAAHSAA